MQEYHIVLDRHGVGKAEPGCERCTVYVVDPPEFSDVGLPFVTHMGWVVSKDDSRGNGNVPVLAFVLHAPPQVAGVSPKCDSISFRFGAAGDVTAARNRISAICVGVVDRSS